MMRVRAIHPTTNGICNATLYESWFGPMKDAIRFDGFNTPYFCAEEISWEFV